MAAGESIFVRYQLTDAMTAGACALSVEVLSPEERARHDRFRFARHRREFAAAHALLRHMLSAHAAHAAHAADAWAFDTGPHGKPALPPALAGSPPLAFNISHTDGLVACAVTRAADVGIDVESIDRVVSSREIARRYFSPSEIAALEACEPDRQRSRFIELWTLKESYLKAVGTGLTQPLNRFAFTIGDEGQLAFEPPPGIDARGWQFHLHSPTPRHRLAVAIRADDDSPRELVIEPAP